jgi:hypothetical protein
MSSRLASFFFKDSAIAPSFPQNTYPLAANGMRVSASFSPFGLIENTEYAKVFFWD